MKVTFTVDGAEFDEAQKQALNKAVEGLVRSNIQKIVDETIAAKLDGVMQRAIDQMDRIAGAKVGTKLDSYFSTSNGNGWGGSDRGRTQDEIRKILGDLIAKTYAENEIKRMIPGIVQKEAINQTNAVLASINNGEAKSIFAEYKKKFGDTLRSMLPQM